MISNTTSPFEDNNDGHHYSDGEAASHQLGEEKNDGVELTTPSMEGAPVDETESKSAENSNKKIECVTPKQRDIFDDLVALGRPVGEIVPSQKILTSLQVRKPKRDEWVRIHPKIFTRVYAYEAKDDGSWYIVLPMILEPLADVVRYVQMSLAVNYNGTPFLWPVSIPTESKPHAAHVSAFSAAEIAMKEWIRISWGSGEYDVYRRQTAKAEPVWPTEISDASAMLRFAAKAGGFEVIDSIDHPIIRAQLGND